MFGTNEALAAHISYYQTIALILGIMAGSILVVGMALAVSGNAIARGLITGASANVLFLCSGIAGVYAAKPHVTGNDLLTQAFFSPYAIPWMASATAVTIALTMVGAFEQLAGDGLDKPGLLHKIRAAHAAWRAAHPVPAMAFAGPDITVTAAESAGNSPYYGTNTTTSNTPRSSKFPLNSGQRGSNSSANDKKNSTASTWGVGRHRRPRRFALLAA
jgi:hypothetical protein